MLNCLLLATVPNTARAQDTGLDDSGGESPAEMSVDDFPYSDDELGLLAEIREADLGIEREYSADGTTFTYRLPADLETPDSVLRGPFLWTYVGQEAYEERPDPVEAGWGVVPEVIYTDMDGDPDEYFGVGRRTMSDQYGRLWRLDAVDVEAAKSEIEAYNRDVAELFGGEAGAAERTGIEYPVDGGEDRFLDPQSWDWINCDSNASDWEITEHSSAGLSLMGSLNERAQKVVRIKYATCSGCNPTKVCSGTLVGNNWVLTAAHCINNGSSAYPMSTYTVCTKGNMFSGAVCSGVDGHTAKEWFDNTPEDDYGVIHLSTTITGLGWMAITQESDSVINGYTQYDRGYPAYTPSCGSNNFTSSPPIINSGKTGGNMYGAAGSIQSTPSGLIKWNISSGDGFSGGPVYYCPVSDCSAHYITGTISGYVNTWSGGYIVGPKGRDMRDWVISNTTP